IAARKQRRVDADVIAAIGEGDAGNSDCGSDAGLRALWRVMSVNPATDTDKDREKAQKSNPIAGEDATAEESDEADSNQSGDAEILPCNDVCAAKIAASLREEQSNDENVINVRRGEC